MGRESKIMVLGLVWAMSAGQAGAAGDETADETILLGEIPSLCGASNDDQCMNEAPVVAG